VSETADWMSCCHDLITLSTIKAKEHLEKRATLQLPPNELQGPDGNNNLSDKRQAEHAGIRGYFSHLCLFQTTTLVGTNVVTVAPARWPFARSAVSPTRLPRWTCPTMSPFTVTSAHPLQRERIEGGRIECTILGASVCP
jgi:hypothetical protein